MLTERSVSDAAVDRKVVLPDGHDLRTRKP
jgi:hypothetical protein